MGMTSGESKELVTVGSQKKENRTGKAMRNTESFEKSPDPKAKSNQLDVN